MSRTQNIMVDYLRRNLLAGYRVSPFHGIQLSLLVTGFFTCIALYLGYEGDLYQLRILDSNLVYILPVSLFIFPAFLEESFFRGILIPQNTKEKGSASVLISTLISAILFTAWHPLNALTLNPSAERVFLDPYFLLIVFCLGVTCSLSYIYSRSLWVPIIIHWLTVVIWVLFLGGRNLILE